MLRPVRIGDGFLGHGYATRRVYEVVCGRLFDVMRRDVGVVVGLRGG